LRKPTYLLFTSLAVAGGCAQGAAPTGSPDSDPGDPGRPDAADGDVDSRPVIPDAEIPDAYVPPPDAACTTSTQQLLVNGNFDASPMGTGWTQLPSNPSYPPIDNGLPNNLEHTQPNSVWLGGLLSSTDALYQQIVVPPGTLSLSLSGFKYFATEETSGTFDFLRFQIRSTADVVLETFQTYSNPPQSDTAWVPITLEPSGSYAGMTVRLYLQSQTDSSLNTNFFLDTFTLTATVRVCQ
jgi:hypothetical protein